MMRGALIAGGPWHMAPRRSTRQRAEETRIDAPAPVFPARLSPPGYRDILRHL